MHDDILINEENYEYCGKIISHHSLKNTIEDLTHLNITLPKNPSSIETDFSLFGYPEDAVIINKIEDIKNIKLNPLNGEEISKKMLISAYDESINKYNGLEGTAYLTIHSLIIHGVKDYYSLTNPTCYFYTRSKIITDQSKYIKYSDNAEVSSKIDYVFDRNEFITNNAPQNSVLFIDGPLIGGQVSDRTVKLNSELLRKDIIPIFFIKNSDSNLVTDGIKELRGKYNSDMHWAYKILKPGERTNFFRYQNIQYENQAKVFCYFKAFNLSPQRIELHRDTFEKYSNIIPDIMDLVYYLILVQGNLKNPQIRSIAIAENYARWVMNLFDINQIMRDNGSTPTMNQERFGGL